MKNAGISMLQIVITVVILLILASVAILYGGNISKEAHIASVYNEMREIEGALIEASMQKKIKIEEEQLSIYNEVNLTKINPNEYETLLRDNDSREYDENGKYYYMDFTHSKSLKETLELENVKHDYILDYDNMNIYLIGGIELNISNSNIPVVRYNSDYIEKYYRDTFRH